MWNWIRYMHCKMEYTNGFMIFLILGLLCNIHSDAQSTPLTYEFSTSLNQNVDVILNCPPNEVVAIDNLQVRNSDNTCRTNLFMWISENFLGQSGGLLTMPAATMTDCDNNDQVTTTYRCVDSSQIINVCRNSVGDITDGELVYLHSPAFPDQYGTNKDCTKYIFVDKRAKIQIIFLDMHKRDAPSTGCYDSLRVLHDFEGSPDFRAHTLCGDEMFNVFDGATTDTDPDYDYYKLALNFFSDAANFETGRVPHRGFLARVELVTYCEANTCPSGEECMNDYQLREAYCVDGDATPTPSPTPTPTTTPTTATTPGTTATSTSMQVPAAQDNCIGVVCDNGGTCVDELRDHFVCQCERGWEGLYCEEASSAVRILNSILVLIVSLVLTLLRH